MIKMEDFQLKPINEEELKIVFQWRNSKRIKSFMYTDHQITWEEHCNWFKSIKQDSTTIVLILLHKNRPLGLVNFTNINKKNRRCYWGFYIGEESALKGAGTIMGIVALDKVFYELGLQKVCSEVIHSNIGSLRYHEKLGFETEGRFVDHVWKGHQYLDVVPMALFADKWGSVRKELLADLGGETYEGD